MTVDVAYGPFYEIQLVRLTTNRTVFIIYNPEVSGDPFSDILKLTDAKSVVSGGFSAGGDWAIHFPPPTKIKFFGTVKGGCYLKLDDSRDLIQIEAGDVFMLSAPIGFTLSSDPSITPVDAKEVFTRFHSGFAKLSSTEDFVQIGGHVDLDKASAALLSDVLPPFIHLKSGSGQAPILHWILDQLVKERSAELPGSAVATGQLAQLMFIQILRWQLEAGESLPTGWLRALNDEQIAPALRLMHGSPEKPWKLEELAAASAMSRTSFAERFKVVAGVPPLGYLVNWRMRLAARSLRNGNMNLAEIAFAIGYSSESAFSNAFKRVVGKSPKFYRADFAIAEESGALNAALDGKE